jgi:hypothetical protein
MDRSSISTGVEGLLGIAFSRCWGSAAFAWGVTEPLARLDEVGVVELEGGSKGCVDVAEEVFHPRGAKGDVVELPHKFLCILDLEGATVRAPGGPEHVDGGGDKLWWGSNGHAA